MNSQSALNLLNSIDQTVAEIDTISGLDPLIDGHLAKYLVVYISGIYEEAVETILMDFIMRNTSRSEVAAFVEKSLDQFFRNPDYSNLIALIAKFGNKTWIDELKKHQHEGFALSSIVNNKNALAHGQSMTITLLDVKQFYASSRPMIEMVDSLVS